MQIDYLDIGQRIRKFRLAKKITQEQLAEKVGVGTTHISHIETGNTKLSIETFIAILNTLDVSADELLRNNIVKADRVLVEEIEQTIRDCNGRELRIIADTVMSLKTSLRLTQRIEGDCNV